MGLGLHDSCFDRISDSTALQEAARVSHLDGASLSAAVTAAALLDWLATEMLHRSVQHKHSVALQSALDQEKFSGPALLPRPCGESQRPWAADSRGFQRSGGGCAHVGLFVVVVPAIFPAMQVSNTPTRLFNCSL